MQEKPLVYVLCGPTASGKTALSLALSRRHGAEILCMDSMQVYQRMDIGTAKPTAAERALVPHHLLDLVPPDAEYSVAQWTAEAEQAIRGVLARGNKPLLVGGTGFYLRALRRQLPLGDAAKDPAIRAALEKEAAAEGGKEKLHRRLEEVDAVTAARLHVNDTRRVIRALEVYAVTGRPFSAQPDSAAEAPFRFRVAALTMDRGLLYARINARVEQMMAAGLAGEVRGLLDSGVSPEAQSMKGIGYKELIPCITGGRDPAEAVAEIQQNTRHYAKRQWTWMRREEDVRWVDSLGPDALAQLEAYFFGEDQHDD